MGLLAVSLNAASAQALTQPRKSGLCKAKTVDAVRKRYPIQQTDYLQFVYVDACALDAVWTAGRGKQRDISFWRPSALTLQAFPGFSYAGDMAVVANKGSGYYLNPPETYATFLVKAQPGRSDFLRKPNNYVYVWSDEKSGGDPDVTMYRPECPNGFDALGLYVAPGINRVGTRFYPDNSLTCFSKSITFGMAPYKDQNSGEPNQSIWSSKNLSGSRDTAFYQGQRTANTKATVKNGLLIPPPTVWAAKDTYDVPDATLFRGLQLPLSQPTPVPLAAARPELTEPNAKSLKSGPPSTHGGFVSAFVVNDEGYYKNDLAKYLDSPQYYVSQETTWEPLDDGRFCRDKGVTECSYSSTKNTTESTTTTWNNTVGVTLTQSVGFEAGFQPLGVGGKVNFSFGIEESYSHDFGGDTQSAQDKGVQITDTLRAPVFAVHIQAETHYKVYRHADTKMNKVNLVREYDSKGGPYDLATFDLDPAPLGDLPTTSIKYLDPNDPIYSADGNHYLFLSTGGTLEVRSAEQGLSQDGAEWSLDATHAHGRLKHPITSVSFVDGQLIVTATGLPTFVSQKEKYPGAQLEIVNGSLRITRMVKNRPQVIWNNKFLKAAKK